MMTKTFLLCPACDACPELEVSDREVRIGEEGNLVRLRAEEWNTLVRLIRSGEVGEL